MRRINQAGLDLIKGFEGLRLRAYQDPVGIWTIGYGSTRDVEPGQVISLDQAEDRLRSDLADAERAVDSLVSVQINDNEFAALVSFVYNVGAGAFARSTMRRLLNRGERRYAASQFARWNKAKGRVLNGLTRRRAAEAALFRTAA
jgi:lysozyme